MIIAERDKKNMKYAWILGLMGIVLGIVVESWVLIVCGIVFTGYGAYTWLSPTASIIKKGETLYLQYAFKTYRIEMSDVQYAACSETHYYTNRSFYWFYRREHDIRTITVTIKRNGSLKHFYLFSVRNASAVVASINGMVQLARKNEGV